MAELGHWLIVLALGVAGYGVGAALLGARRGRAELMLSARRSVFVVAALLTAAFAILEAAFLRTDLTYEVVATHSSDTTPGFYKAAAAWSSQEGSLLLWVWLLSLWSSLVLVLVRRRLRDVQPYAIAVLLGMAAFFCGLLVFAASPFDTLARAPAEGAGLNPLLRHPSMMIHPPMLYSGYTLFAIPFAFAIGALIVRRVDAEWIGATRRFALGAWFFLGVGILLGARWSYAELGWGGYWAWDPVENASLMPWLTGTAFLHSIMLQERRGMLKVWNASLILATGTLAVLGTFLVRSGILDSIHAFGASTLGVPFVCLIGVMIAGSVWLVASRRELLRSEHRLDSLLSREAVFLGNNLVLVGLCFVVFWGTFFPLIAEALTGEKRAIGPPWFDRYTVPLALLLVLLSGIGPVIAWRRATLANARRNFAVPLLAAAAALVATAAAGAADRPLALVMFGCAAFVLAAVGQEFWRGIGARRAMAGGSPPAALVALVRRNRRRYGGYIVHVGIAVLFVGVAASSAFETNRTVSLAPGESARVGGYELRYDRATAGASERAGGLEKIDLGARVTVLKDGEVVTRLATSRGYYPAQDERLGRIGRFFESESVTEVGLDAGLLKDYWVAVAPDGQFLNQVVRRLDQRLRDADQADVFRAVGNLANFMRARPATFRFVASPMVAWIWLGGIIVFIGAAIALWPAPDALRRRATAGYAGRVARDLGRA